MLTRDPACPLCGSAPSIKGIDARNCDRTCPVADGDDVLGSDVPLEIDVEDAQALLAGGNGAVLLDVREPYELELCQLPGAVCLPLRQIPARLAELPADRHVLVLCHHGERSRFVTEYLRAHGRPRASNIAGGIDAWACRLDPALPRY
jgi:adenylyltransferase/sulfurtransferase